MKEVVRQNNIWADMQWDAVEIIIPNEELELQMKEFIKHLHCGLIISPAPMSNAGIHPRASGEPLTAAFIRAGINAH